jgi:hypothetical protein
MPAMEQQQQAVQASADAPTATDERFTLRLMLDLVTVLEKHGYVREHSRRAAERLLVAAVDLAEAFEGRGG